VHLKVKHVLPLLAGARQPASVAVATVVAKHKEDDI
jgi:hypothetical protein